MNNLIDIQSQIEKLQKQAADIKIKEFQKTVQEIRAKMQAFGISLKDLQVGKAPRGNKAKVKVGESAKRIAAGTKKKSGTTVAVKYQGPNGESWSGRGLTPRWLASLVVQGRTKEEFAIKS
ncbi:MAG: H-NS histone family protein [Gammaproteobacteria bacterium]|nr:H-NS histone family protein [Gammaproteobacteria bacterium]MBU0788331.1 H-NS histone family protein [Gammaproteobacteria bacterium]MBU0815172.1 H-NS histone family protein [Gammaproteobacteria bacterium]MBU1785720.1 H-NS histone family protein [Gammaproteobacteria bacterium]